MASGDGVGALLGQDTLMGKHFRRTLDEAEPAQPGTQKDKHVARLADDSRQERVEDVERRMARLRAAHHSATVGRALLRWLRVSSPVEARNIGFSRKWKLARPASTAVPMIPTTNAVPASTPCRSGSTRANTSAAGGSTMNCVRYSE